MTNKDLWQTYSFYTEELTKFSRQLAYAAAAICWFFKSSAISFPKPIVFALSFLILFFVFDILQYFISAHLIRWWTRNAERRMWIKDKTIEGEYLKPWWVDSPAFIFFNLKVLALVLSFVSIGYEFASRL